MKKVFFYLILFILSSYFLIHNSNSVYAAPTISGILDNRADYPNSRIPKYEKLEIKFNISQTTATNFQWPYDPNPPTGVTAGKGITVNAVFTSPSGQTFTQPAFYYQPYAEDRTQPNALQRLYVPQKDGRDWLYPVGQPYWVIRFAPNQEGINTWSYRITAQDSSGTTQSSTTNFSVAPSTSHGFVRVAKNDSRYFEFDDGTFFPGMGYNMNWDHIHWNDPIGNIADKNSNVYNLQQMGLNGIQHVRLWLSEWALFGSKWNPWRCILSACGPDWPEISTESSYADHNVSIAMYASYNPCMSSGILNWLSPLIPIEPNSTYRIRVRVRTIGISGPRDGNPNHPFGFVAKVTDDGNSWLQGSGNNCQDYGVGKTVTNYLGTSGWTEAIGTYTSPSTVNFLSSFYLTLTNVNDTGAAYVDQVVMEKDLGGGNYGPNIIVKPGMNHHQYMDQRTSFAFDKVVELAHQNGVYLRPVILEWSDQAQNIIDSYDVFGNYREVRNVRWYQQAYWRYLQARYGYSPNIHSWELFNEAGAFISQGRDWTMADEFGKYMHCRVFGVEPGTGDGVKCALDHPNDHLVSTSQATGFPRDEFWANTDFPNVDFADLHRYIAKNTGGDDWLDPNFYDTAKSTYDTSMYFGAKQSGGAGKPVIRGETALTDKETGYPTSDILSDTNAVWLHNFVWGGINPGGLIESYWHENYGDGGHLYSYILNEYTGMYETIRFDFRPVYKTYYNFIKDTPLSNGKYVDAAATAPSGIRAWGQKDLTNARAHLWISNANARWNNSTRAVNGTVTINFGSVNANKPLKVEWWNAYTGAATNTQTITTNVTGVLTLEVNNTTDIAVRIGDYTPLPSPTSGPSSTPSPTPSYCDIGILKRDFNCDGKINIIDAVVLIKQWGTSDAIANLDGIGTVDASDMRILLGNIGK